MLVIGLTGATGAGKGEFAKALVKNFKALHIDTDITARKVCEKGEPCLDELVAEYGEGILNADGNLDRKILADIVFSDKDKLLKLNEITHKHVLSDVEKVLEKAEKDGKAIAIVDAPLLFESGADKMCDVTVGILASRDLREERIIERDNISEERAEKRLDNAKPDSFFTERCDYILVNDYEDISGYEKAACRLLSEILKKYKTERDK